MRTALVLLALVAFAACTVGVSARRHHSHHAAAPAVNVTQSERAWLLDASVVDQGVEAENVAAPDAWVLYKQCGESWSNDHIGFSSNTICAVGCAMSSVAMSLKSKGTDVNPGSLNTWLKGHGGFASGDLLVWSAVNAFGTIKLNNYYHGPGSLSEAGLQGVISNGWPVIANVRGGSHWVLVTGHAGGSTYSVNDPGFSVSSYSYGDISNFVVYSA